MFFVFFKIHVMSPCLTSVTLLRIPWVASEATKRFGDEIHRAPIWSRADLGFPPIFAHVHFVIPDAHVRKYVINVSCIPYIYSVYYIVQYNIILY